jgi:mycothiol synthase
MSTSRTPHPYVESRFEHGLEMLHPSRERATPPRLPPGYTLRSFRDGDERAYDELFHLAWSDEGTLAHTRAHALPGGFLVVEHDATQQLVASCVAFGVESPERHPHDGSLGWLVVDAAHGGRGLGTLVAATVTNQLLDEGYARPWLGTEDDRLVAIALYLKLGWEPHLYVDGMAERWRDIRSRIAQSR